MQNGEIITRYLDVELSDHEVFEYGKEQSRLLLEVKEFEAERKLVNDQIKPRKNRIDALAPMIDSGIENRLVDCYWDYDWENGIKSVRRCDTGEIVGATQEIGKGEEQPLPLNTKKKGK